MKAIVQHRYGAPQDVLHLAEVDMPVAGDDEVLVWVRASSANPWDWHFIRGEPLLVRPAGGRRPQTEVPGPGRGPRRNGPAGGQRRHGFTPAMRCTASATAPSPSTSRSPRTASRASRRI